MLTLGQLTPANFDQVHTLCQRCLVYDDLPREAFAFVIQGDPDFDPELAITAEEDGSVQGFLMAARRSNPLFPSGIKLFAVAPEWRNRGIATRLLAEAEARLAARGVQVIEVSQTRPNYFYTGVDPRYTPAILLLQRHGYTQTGTAINMAVDLSASGWDTAQAEERLRAQHIVCRTVTPEDLPRLAAWFDNSEFGEGWKYQAMHAAKLTPPAVVIAEHNGEIAGFSSWNGVRPGWFGPIGVEPRLRGAGVGAVLLLQSLRGMKQEGHRTCEINSVGPIYFYSRVAQATISRTFWKFEKRLA